MHYLCKRQTLDCGYHQFYYCYYFVLWLFHFRFSAWFVFVTSVDVLANKCDERRRCSGTDKDLLSGKPSLKPWQHGCYSRVWTTLASDTLFGLKFRVSVFLFAPRLTRRKPFLSKTTEIGVRNWVFLTIGAIVGSDWGSIVYSCFGIVKL